MISTAEDPFFTIPDCPVIDEFFRQIRGECYRLDLTKLWEVVGRPKGFEPRVWAKSVNAVEGVKRVKVLSRRPGMGYGAMGHTAFLYATECDERIGDAFEEYYRPRYGRNVIKAICCEPTPIIGMLAICDVMKRQDGSPTIAADTILFELVHDLKQSDLDEFDQETIVARVHRALRGDRQLPHPRNPAYWPE